METKKYYVLGFMFSQNGRDLVVIRKTHPSWLAGKINVPGGHIRNMDLSPFGAMLRGLRREMPSEACAREFGEETGVATHPGQWEHFMSIKAPVSNYEIWCYRMFTDKAYEVKTQNNPASDFDDEEISVIPVAGFLHLQKESLADGMQWMVPLAMDKHLNFIEVERDNLMS